MAFVTHPDDRMIEAYDRLAPAYDMLHRRWLRFAGGEAQAALEAAVRMAMTPKSVLLDAGCGTGRFARTLLSEGVAPGQITLLDPSHAMLTQCQDIPVEQIQGRLEKMPFADAAFDIVTCAWAVETVPYPERAVKELCRVLRPGGVLCLTFCAETPTLGFGDRIMRHALTRRGTGSFLPPAGVRAVLTRAMSCDVRNVPCAGPAATIIARRRSSSHHLSWNDTTTCQKIAPAMLDSQHTPT